MIKLLDVKPFRQSPSYCGPASLKMVLEYYGISKSEKELAKLSKHSEKGTKAENIVLAAKKLGLNATIKDNSTLKDIRDNLKKKIPVIVDWFSQDDGHYSVAIGIDKENIYLQDPELGNIRTIKLDTFIRIWFDFPNNYIKNNKEIILRRIILIHN